MAGGAETKGVKPEAGGKLEAGSGERGQRSGLRERCREEGWSEGDSGAE